MSSNSGQPAHTNKLINETSPYLLQHAHNPVEWYPWGAEALDKAKAENKPILLSVGYSACHWCHVMERESFENEATAALMNQNFVNIKVDREERPDIDSIYMEAVQAMTGRGGWPMTVFLTPEGLPFYGGTYFPPDNRYGSRMPSFPQLLAGIAQSYHEKPEDIAHNAEQLKTVIQSSLNFAANDQGETLEVGAIDGAVRQIESQMDRQEGGLGGAPKFPQAMVLDVLLRGYARTRDPQTGHLLTLTLDKMANGGLYDQLGGGFHRYSTDDIWLVPHFEKMLYDNAQLALLYLHGWQVTGNEFYRDVARHTLDYVVREMTDPKGGFYSAQDADSEGVEGKFFVWQKSEIEQILGGDAAAFIAFYGVTERGNFEEANILHVDQTFPEVAAQLKLSEDELEAKLQRGITKLFNEREKRVKPGLDDKVLTAWNGLMLKAFAVAARLLNSDEYRQVAIKNAEFVMHTLRQPNGRLLRTWKNTEQGGKAHLNAFLEDYAFYADGLLALYEATFDRRWLDEAVELAHKMIGLFWDKSQQIFYDTATDHEQLVTRPRHLYDNAVPSGNSVAADVLLKLGKLTDNADLYEPAITTLDRMGRTATDHPTAFGRLVSALDFYIGADKEIVIVGSPDAPDTQALLATIDQTYLPNRVLMLLDTATTDAATLAKWPLLADRTQINGHATAYVCQNYACQQPVTDPAALAKQLQN